MKIIIAALLSIVLCSSSIYGNKDSIVWLVMSGANMKSFKTANMNNLLVNNNYPLLDDRYMAQALYVGFIKDRLAVDVGLSGFRHSAQAQLISTELRNTYFRDLEFELNFTYNILKSNSFILGPTLGYCYYWRSIGLESKEAFAPNTITNTQIRKLTNEGLELLLGVDSRIFFRKLRPDRINWMLGIRAGYMWNLSREWYQENIVPFSSQNLLAGRWGASFRIGI